MRAILFVTRGDTRGIYSRIELGPLIRPDPWWATLLDADAADDN